MTEPRRISLPLAADTPDTGCGECPALDVQKDYWSADADILCDRFGGKNCDGYRLPDCLAAEREHVAMIEAPSAEDWKTLTEVAGRAIDQIRSGSATYDRLHSVLAWLDSIGGRYG